MQLWHLFMPAQEDYVKTRRNRAQLLIRGQGQTKQGLKASVDPGEPEV